MVVKLANKKIPVGFQPSEFRYVGRPASEQGDFGPQIGMADMVPVNGRGVIGESRYFHIGVVEAQGHWFVYMECGRASGERSWIGDSPRPGLDFMFARCRDEQDARRFFRRQCMTMNIGRILRSGVGAEPAWVAKTDVQGNPEDAWLVGAPRIHDRGLAGPEPERFELSVVQVANSRPQPNRRVQALAIPKARRAS